MRFLAPLVITPIGRGMWKLWEDFGYETNADEEINIYKGFVTDGYSVPWIFRSFLSPLSQYPCPAVLHDFLYAEGLYSRHECDRIFEEAMQCVGMCWLRRKLIYYAVRLGSWIAWYKHRRRVKV